MLQGIGIQSKRFNDPMRSFASIRRIEQWKKYGNVKLVDFADRQNVVCLTNKKRAAKIRIFPQLTIMREYKFTVEVYSPVENQSWGVGTVIADEPVWHPSNGMWKKIEAVITPGNEIVIESSGKDREIVAGDKCYVDLSSILIL